MGVLTRGSRFSELRFWREFTEFMTSQFVAEAATCCLAIKRKDNITGKTLTPGKAVEIAFGDGLIVDVEPENSLDQNKGLDW